jgi:hypothetical protein
MRLHVRRVATLGRLAADGKGIESLPCAVRRVPVVLLPFSSPFFLLFFDVSLLSSLLRRSPLLRSLFFRYQRCFFPGSKDCWFMFTFLFDASLFAVYKV